MVGGRTARGSVALFEKCGKEFPAFLTKGIQHYCANIDAGKLI